ncbi:MAG TPA: nuclear transport factor 2 family protein [Gemmatimonadaceae bacterium]|nr:nuclear transport factor 2 family protein [Gemmatimonadaceae bacterium]
MSHTQTIQSLYAAFGKGDVPTILAALTDDVDWNNDRVASKECPWNGNFSGKKKVPGFFKAVGDNFDFAVFDPHTFVETGNTVAVVLRLESTLKKNGKSLKNDAVHVWTFDKGGKVSRYRHFNDTAQELAAWKA